MRVFVINLPKDTQKRQNFISNFKDIDIKYEFIEGIYGKDLSQSELEKLVYDYKNSLMMPGEIGCALSHQKIYQKMIDENIAYALILEDDAIFTPKALNYINKIDQFLSSKNDFEIAVLMQFDKDKAYFKNLKIKVNDEINLYKMAKGMGNYGYIITQKAAKKLLEINTPLILEADCWVQFNKFNNLQIYCVNENIIKTTDEKSLNSSIGSLALRFEPQRAKERARFRKKVLRKIGGINYLIGSFRYRIIYKIYSKFIQKGSD